MSKKRKNLTLSQFADIIGADLEIIRYSNQNNRFTCSFEGSETKTDKDSSIIEGTYGQGYSITAAMKNYVTQLRGKLLVFNAYRYSGKRREFQVPLNLVFG